MKRAESGRARAQAKRGRAKSAVGGGNVIVFGGSFDPVHRWHMAVVTAARRWVEKRTGEEAGVLLVPAARSPHKRVEEGPRASDADRVEMLGIASRRMARTEVWMDELDRAARSRARGGEASPSYTVETLRRLLRTLPRGSRVWLLIGGDQAEKFHLWREYRAVMKIAEVLVVLRPPRRRADGLLRVMRETGAWSEKELAEWGLRVVKCEAKAVSSTQAREAARKRDGARLKTLVSPGVAKWIAERGLYGWEE